MKKREEVERYVPEKKKKKKIQACNGLKIRKTSMGMRSIRSWGKKSKIRSWKAI